MKISRILVILLLPLILILQSCGSGGGGSDTSGVLTMTVPAVAGGAKIGDIANVTFNVTYTPPAGKVPNGTIIKTRISDSSGTVLATYDTQLYSNISYADSFPVIATATQQFYIISLSIGSMTAGSSVTIPAGT